VELVNGVTDRILQVSERQIAVAVGDYAKAGLRVEGAAASALAALAAPELAGVDGPIVLLVTGRNIDDALYLRAIEQPESFPD